MDIPVKIAGVGFNVPEAVVTNDDLTKIIDTSDEWIKTRTGIERRHVLSGNETAVEMGIKAAEKALAKSKIDAEKIDLIIAAASVETHAYPSSACEIQAAIGAMNAACFDITAACSGLIYGMGIARAFIKSGSAKNVLIVATDAISRCLDWTDRTTCVLFGDGAGAMVLTVSDDDQDDILAIELKAEGNLGDFIKMPIPGKNCPLVEPNDEEKMFVKMDGKVEDTDYSSKYYAQQSADKFAEIPAAVDSGLSALSNASNALRTTQITNCITEIPQDIKLELADGVLTLKADSKIYIPNGFEEDGVTKKFDEVIIQGDITTQGSIDNSVSRFVYYDLTYNGLLLILNHSSGAVPPTASGNVVFYNINNNTVRLYTDGSIITADISLPLGVVTSDGVNLAGSINQVFNGFGYIGKTVFALPGIKGLIPNGRNTDGTLNNQEFELDEVLIGTLDPNVPAGETVFVVRKQNSNQMISFFKGLFDARNTSDLASDTPWYNLYYLKDENKLRAGNQVEIEAYVGGWVFCDENYNITSFRPKTTFTAVDYSAGSWIAAQAMPGEKYINLTLGASNTVYTAPANGYFTLAKMANNGQHIYMSNGRISVQSWVSTTGYIQSFLPVQKGDSLNIGYTATGDTAFFRFVYAQGEE